MTENPNEGTYVPPQQLTPGGPIHGGFHYFETPPVVRTMPPAHTPVPFGPVDRALTEILAELKAAQEEFASFHSPHEGWAVILEEVEEMWNEIKANNTELSIREAIQVAAMALRYIVDMRAREARKGTLA